MIHAGAAVHGWENVPPPSAVPTEITNYAFGKVNKREQTDNMGKSGKERLQYNDDSLW